jgi:hypothetical protein
MELLTRQSQHSIDCEPYLQAGHFPPRSYFHTLELGRHLDHSSVLAVA